MKKFLVILAVFSFSAATVPAQTLPAKAAHGQHRMHGDKAAKTPEQRADHAARSLTKQLGLSATQIEQVRQLHLSRAKEMQAYKGQASTTPATKRQHREAMNGKKAQYDVQLKQILSTDQYAKYTQLQSDRMAKRKAHQSSKQAKG